MLRSKGYTFYNYKNNGVSKEEKLKIVLEIKPILNICKVECLIDRNHKKNL